MRRSRLRSYSRFARTRPVLTSTTARQIGTLFFLTTVFLVVATILSPSRGLAQQTTVLVAVAPVIQTEVSAQADFVATVHPVRRSITGSAVDGRVVEFLSTGDNPSNKITRVKTGQALAKLRATTLEINLAAARAELQIRQQQHAELKNGARPEELAAALAKQRGAMARMEFTRTKYERAKGLFEQRKTVSREQLDLALSDAIEAEQGYREAKAQNELLIAGARPEQIAQAEARVLAQEEAIRSLERHPTETHHSGSLRRLCSDGAYRSRSVAHQRRRRGGSNPARCG